MRKWLPLVAICLGTFMLLIDVTIVNVALPDIARDLGTASPSCSGSSTSTRWPWPRWCSAPARWPTSTADAGSTWSGSSLFAVASLACGLAPDAGWLIAARAVQGMGGAIMFATTIALINTSYEGRDRGTAFGVWGAVVGAAAALGPILGGALTELSWRWIFFVNLPVMRPGRGA